MERKQAQSKMKEIRTALKVIFDGGATYKGTGVRQNAGYERSYNSFLKLEEKLGREPSWYDIIFYEDERGYGYNGKPIDQCLIKYDGVEGSVIAEALTAAGIDYRWPENEHTAFTIYFDGFEEYDKALQDQINIFTKILKEDYDMNITTLLSGNLDKDVQTLRGIHWKENELKQEEEIESLSIKSGISVELVKSYFSGQYDSPSWNSSMKTWPEHVEALKKNVDGTCWFKYEHQAKDSLEDSFKEFIKSAPDLLVPYIDKEKWLKSAIKKVTIGSYNDYYIITV